MFKLIKSNSCSSRLELAGSLNEDEGCHECTELNLVKEMVHIFECNKSLTQPTAANEHDRNASHSVYGRTKNHKSAERLNELARTTLSLQLTESTPPNANSQKTHNALLIAGRDNCLTSVECVSLNCRENGVKVSRNKNVDLAFNLAKQQQNRYSNGIDGQDKARAASDTIQLQDNCVNLSKLKFINVVGEEFAQRQTGASNKSLVKSVVENFQTQDANSNQFNYSPIQINANKATNNLPNDKIKINQTNLVLQYKVENRKKEDRTRSRAMIMMSGTRAQGQLAASGGTGKMLNNDKSLVKHYVTNDKSIYERRKYDEIEFETFEVYDPAKEHDKISDNEPRAMLRNQNNKECINNECNRNVSRDVQRELANKGVQSECTAVDEHGRAPHSSTSRDRGHLDYSSPISDNDCYDSLDDKL